MIEAAATPDPETRKAGTMDWESFFKEYRNPDFIPGYTVINKLGGGVFGEVYKAKKTSIGKYYAIKFLKIQDERISEQILRELEVIDHFAQVDHPNLVSVEDRGEVHGIPYIVMGYAGDETLKTLLGQGAIPQDRSAALYRQILAGVKALHEHSIVHFDLKPANIFINGEIARVGDYGLSKLMSESRGTLSMGRGTPYYMAPEMLRRRGDARSDVYSLGVILFEMLTGEVPFKGDSEWQILKKHETEAVVIPRDLGSGLRAFLTQSLDKDPERRFRNAGAMLNAFESALQSDAGHPSPAAIPPPLGRSETEPPPLPTQNPERVGRAAGRMAHQAEANIERIRQGLSDILVRLDENTRRAVKAARKGYREASTDGALAEGVPGAAPSGRCGSAPRPPRVVRRLLGGIGDLILLPFRVVGWAISHLVQVAAVLALAFGLGYLIHLGLKAAILS